MYFPKKYRQSISESKYDGKIVITKQFKFHNIFYSRKFNFTELK